MTDKELCDWVIGRGIDLVALGIPTAAGIPTPSNTNAYDPDEVVSDWRTVGATLETMEPIDVFQVFEGWYSHTNDEQINPRKALMACVKYG